MPRTVEVTAWMGGVTYCTVFFSICQRVQTAQQAKTHISCLEHSPAAQHLTLQPHVDVYIVLKRDVHSVIHSIGYYS